MGSKSSKPTHVLNNEILESEALRKFNKRVKEYKYKYHGDYTEYIEWCSGQYQLDLEGIHNLTDKIKITSPRYYKSSNEILLKI